jgi:F-type H+-transporting ATPase subunit b
VDKLLNPDIGLTVWTVVTFLALLVVLGKFVWRPILGALDAREELNRGHARAAEESRREAETLRRDYEARLAHVEVRTKELLSQAEADARRIREEMLKTAQAEAEKIAAKTREQLAEEQRRLVRELRTEVASLTVAAAEKMIRRSIDVTVRDQVLSDALGRFDAPSGKV